MGLLKGQTLFGKSQKILVHLSFPGRKPFLLLPLSFVRFSDAPTPLRVPKYGVFFLQEFPQWRNSSGFKQHQGLVNYPGHGHCHEIL
jgi:hypothetical protein